MAGCGDGSQEDTEEEKAAAKAVAKAVAKLVDKEVLKFPGTKATAPRAYLGSRIYVEVARCRYRMTLKSRVEKTVGWKGEPRAAWVRLVKELTAYHTK